MGTEVSSLGGGGTDVLREWILALLAARQPMASAGSIVTAGRTFLASLTDGDPPPTHTQGRVGVKRRLGACWEAGRGVKGRGLPAQQGDGRGRTMQGGGGGRGGGGAGRREGKGRGRGSAVNKPGPGHTEDTVAARRGGGGLRVWLGAGPPPHSYQLPTAALKGPWKVQKSLSTAQLQDTVTPPSWESPGAQRATSPPSQDCRLAGTSLALPPRLPKPRSTMAVATD